jgi:hypothetical protein
MIPIAAICCNACSLKLFPQATNSPSLPLICMKASLILNVNLQVTFSNLNFSTNLANYCQKDRNFICHIWLHTIIVVIHILMIMVTSMVTHMNNTTDQVDGTFWQIILKVMLIQPYLRIICWPRTTHSNRS